MNFLEQLALDAEIISNESNEIDIVELMSENLASMSHEAVRVTGLMEALQSNYDFHIAGKDTVTMEAYQAYTHATQAILNTSGIDLPVSIVVPSFESSEDLSLEAEEKKDNVVVRAGKALWELLKRLYNFLTGWMKKADEEGEKKTEQLKAEVTETKAVEKEVEEEVQKASVPEAVKAEVISIKREVKEIELPNALVKNGKADKAMITGQFLPYAKEVVSLLAETSGSKEMTDAITAKYRKVIAAMSAEGTTKVKMELSASLPFAEAVSAAAIEILPKLRGEMVKMRERLKTLTAEAEKVASENKAIKSELKTQNKEDAKANAKIRGLDEKLKNQKSLQESVKMIESSLAAATKLHSLTSKLQGQAIKIQTIYRMKLASARNAARKAA